MPDVAGGATLGGGTNARLVGVAIGFIFVILKQWLACFSTWKDLRLRALGLSCLTGRVPDLAALLLALSANDKWF
nr:hypothetical protein [Chromobacterium sp. ASV5]